MNFQNHVGLDNLRCVVILPFLYNSMVKGGSLPFSRMLMFSEFNMYLAFNYALVMFDCSEFSSDNQFIIIS
jgi:hypothetical protein